MIVSSNNLIKISAILRNPIQKVTKYRKAIKIVENNIYIILGVKAIENNEDIQLLKKQLLKNSKYIETKVNFQLLKTKEVNNHYFSIGKYDCKNFSDDQMRKIIHEWQTFGYKMFDFKMDGSARFIQNTMY